MNCYAPFEGNEACISPLLKATGAKSSFRTHLFLGKASWLLWRYLMGIPADSTVSTKPTCFNATKNKAEQHNKVEFQHTSAAWLLAILQVGHWDRRGDSASSHLGVVWRVTVQGTITWDPPFTGMFGISSTQTYLEWGYVTFQGGYFD